VEALEGLTPDRLAEQVERLAHHALRGEVWDKALTYSRQAGEKAMAQSAYRAAVGYFEQGLRVLPHLPEQRDTREHAIDLRLALRSALGPVSYGFECVLTLLREAEALATALDDHRRLAQVSRFLSRHFHLMGAHDQAMTTAQRALALATADGDAVMQALASDRLGLAYQSQGDYRRAIACFRQTVIALDEAQSRERFGQVILPAVHARANLAQCHAELGTFAEGRAFGEEGLRMAEAVAHPASLLYALWGSSLLALCHGDIREVLPPLERALGFCQDADLRGYFPLVASVLGTAYTLGGRVADAVPLLTQAVEQTMVRERVDIQALCLLPLVEAYRRAGRLEEAHTLAERTLTHTRQHQERGKEAYALCLLGEIAARREPPESERAAAHYRQALTLADELGMRPLQAHCHRGLGTLYAAMGQWEQARAELCTAVGFYRDMDMGFWLPQAEAALVQVEGQ
jgi:tetratricopeptide (TPR) repeat protein